MRLNGDIDIGEGGCFSTRPRTKKIDCSLPFADHIHDEAPHFLKGSDCCWGFFCYLLVILHLYFSYRTFGFFHKPSDSHHAA